MRLGHVNGTLTFSIDFTTQSLVSPGFGLGWDIEFRLRLAKRSESNSVIDCEVSHNELLTLSQDVYFIPIILKLSPDHHGAGFEGVAKAKPLTPYDTLVIRCVIWVGVVLAIKTRITTTRNKLN